MWIPLLMRFFNRRQHKRGWAGMSPGARTGIPMAGGLLPMAAYLAWQNRDKLKALYDQHIRPRAGTGPMRPATDGGF